MRGTQSLALPLMSAWARNRHVVPGRKVTQFESRFAAGLNRWNVGEADSLIRF